MVGSSSSKLNDPIETSTLGPRRPPALRTSMVLPSSLSSFRPLAVLSTSLRGSAGSRLVATAASAAQPLVLHRHLLRRPLTSSPPVDRRAQIDHGPRFSNIRRSPREILATPQRPPPRNDDDVLVEVPDDPHGVLQGSTAEIILSNAALIVTRQSVFAAACCQARTSH